MIPVDSYSLYMCTHIITQTSIWDVLLSVRNLHPAGLFRNSRKVVPASLGGRAGCDDSHRHFLYSATAKGGKFGTLVFVPHDRSGNNLCILLNEPCVCATPAVTCGKRMDVISRGRRGGGGFPRASCSSDHRTKRIGDDF